VVEWVVDSYNVDDAKEFYAEPCTDCAWTEWTVRILKGGSAANAVEHLRVAKRGILLQSSWSTNMGVRCARDRGTE
jgi:formylglycine-generating enzyme required for sulfatase activity